MPRPLLKGKELIAATKPFAVENRSRSWGCLISTYSLLLASAAVAAAAPAIWPVRLFCSLLTGLLSVRTFMLFHDHVHGAILRDSKVAGVVLNAFGYYILTPPKNWRQSHNYHHAHTAQVVGSHVGSFALLTTQLWGTITPAQRKAYRIIRHPLTISVGVFTIFVWGMVLAPLVRDPKKHLEAFGSIGLHAVLAAVLIHFFGLSGWIFGAAIPVTFACGLGGYLFYAQHNFPGMHIEPRQTWEYSRAALESSSYMKMSPLMEWFTGNIGYHHVHHLNPSIPFYRLPETMAALPELQNPGITSLSPRDVIACFRLKLWDKDARQMVAYPSELAAAGAASGVDKAA